MALRRVLVLDSGENTVIPEHSWSEFIDDDDDIELYIFSSIGTLTDKDKSNSKIKEYKEVKNPTKDGTMELWSFEMHKKHSFTHVFTRNEDLILRAGHLRTLLGLSTGLNAQSVGFYREKATMKERAAQQGFPVPPFARLYAPSDLIGFIEKYGYPVVIKPTLGCATSGLHLLRNADDLQTYLSSTLFQTLDTNERLDLVGELLVEGYMKGAMYHVDGIARNGILEYVWPFAYLHTCLSFTQEGSAYGNSYIPKSEPIHQRLCQAAQRFLNVLPTPSDGLVFHLELYENLDPNRASNDEFVLCEIAARAPGASITHLIDMVSFKDDQQESFARLAFRASTSLPIKNKIEQDPNYVITDLIIPRRPGKIMFMPRECPIKQLTYIPLADVDKPTEYTKFNIDGINSSCRFIAETRTRDEGQKLVEQGLEWFQETYIHIDPEEPFTATLIKELHRYFHRRVFA